MVRLFFRTSSSKSLWFVAKVLSSVSRHWSKERSLTFQESTQAQMDFSLRGLDSFRVSLCFTKTVISFRGLFQYEMCFIPERHAYDRNRLTLVRYDNLALTHPDYRLTMMSRDPGNGPSSRMTASEVDQFVVPLNLPDLFCWIHDCAGENFGGRPWDRQISQILGFGIKINCGLNLNEQKAVSSRPFRYHLELQLLMDDLKQARAERRVSKAQEWELRSVGMKTPTRPHIEFRVRVGSTHHIPELGGTKQRNPPGIIFGCRNQPRSQIFTDYFRTNSTFQPNQHYSKAIWIHLKFV